MNGGFVFTTCPRHLHQSLADRLAARHRVRMGRSLYGVARCKAMLAMPHPAPVTAETAKPSRALPFRGHARPLRVSSKSLEGSEPIVCRGVTRGNTDYITSTRGCVVSVIAQLQNSACASLITHLHLQHTNRKRTMNTKPYQVVNSKTGEIIWTTGNLPAAYRRADRLGAGFEVRFA
jgi:hypothetical protein